MEEEKEVIRPVVDVEVTGVSSVFAAFGFAMVAILSAAAGYWSPHPENDRCKADAAVQVANLKSVETQVRANIAQQKNAFDLQMKVAQACSDRSGVPVFAGGNVGCQK